MEKIICDICGTSYPSSTDCCPICGCSNAAAAELLGEDVSYEEFLEETEVEALETSEDKKKKAIFDFDKVNPDEEPLDEDFGMEENDDDDSDDDDEKEVDEEEDDDEDEDDEDEEPHHNSFVVILLTILIVVLLGAAGFIFVRYFLPNMGNEETVPTTAAVQETDASVPTTEVVVPCDHMAMTNAGVAELSAEGQQFLLHIKALPENTTDKIIYTSGDESIATVTEDGKITAISEGETTIYISCGIQRIECPVIVKYVEETVPPTTEAVEEETQAATEAEEETKSEDEEASEAQGDSGLKDVKLKLKKTDIQLGVYYSFRLELDCDLDPEEVTWTSEHPHIAKVDETGSVTAVKSGTTSVTAKYGDQEVKCMVRCIWY